MREEKVILRKKEFLSSRDAYPTEIQELIEMTVTNGRGYLSLEESISFVNREQRCTISVYDCIEGGILPVNISSGPWFESSNSCGEIILPEAQLCVLPAPKYGPTLLDLVKGIQKKKKFEQHLARIENPLLYLAYDF